MSAVSVSVDNSPAVMPVGDLIATLDGLGVKYRRRGDALALRGGSVLTDELRGLLSGHKEALLAYCDALEGYSVPAAALADVDEELPAIRSRVERLFGLMVRARCESPKKATRESVRAYIQQEIQKLEKQLDGCGGYLDPLDPWSGDTLQMLQTDWTELTRADAPYPVPLPPGCQLLPQANFDPFEHGRYYSGKLLSGLA